MEISKQPNISLYVYLHVTFDADLNPTFLLWLSLFILGQAQAFSIGLFKASHWKGRAINQRGIIL